MSTTNEGLRTQLRDALEREQQLRRQVATLRKVLIGDARVAAQRIAGLARDCDSVLGESTVPDPPWPWPKEST